VSEGKRPGEIFREKRVDPIQDFKSLRVAVMICATLVNTQTHTDSFQPVILSAYPNELNDP